MVDVPPPSTEPLQEAEKNNVNNSDDDEMADLFSFGAEEEDDPSFAAAAGTSTAVRTTTTTTTGASNDNGPRQERAGSDDSFLDLLEAEGGGGGSTVVPGGGGGGGTGTTAEPSSTSVAAAAAHDLETQEILDWLDHDDDHDDNEKKKNADDEDKAAADGSQAQAQAQQAVATTASNETNDDQKKKKKKESTKDESAAAAAAAPAPPAPPTPTVVSLPPVFTSLDEALDSDQSTPQQIRQLIAKQQQQQEQNNNNTTGVSNIITASQRPELYCRMVCGKPLKELLPEHSSLAGSFEQWQHNAQTTEVTTDPATGAVQDWLREQAAVVLAPRVASAQQATTGHDETTSSSSSSCQQDLEKLLLYHYQNNNSNKEKDVLIPPVAATILACGIPVAAASVVLAQIVPHFMPLLALEPQERWEAALSLHHELYLLACYHIPLLVFHLDRYMPGWYWPKVPTTTTTTTLIEEEEEEESMDQENNNTSTTEKARNLQKQGHLPPSWLLSHLSGECEGTLFQMDWVLNVWDATLTGSDNATRFFLALAVLEQASDQLLLLTGDELEKKLQSVLELQDKGDDWVDEWWTRAKTLQASTPESVLSTLRKAEDEAVQQALKRRQERAEAELKARLEAEAAAHREAQERKADAARERLTRARLVAFYRKHAPDKEGNIDKIMTTYAGRLDVLDDKLRLKYGEGFNPALKPKPPNMTRNTSKSLLSTINQQEESDNKDKEAESGPSEEQVSVLVSAAEVLPVVCWSKEAAAARGQQRRRSLVDRKQLKFFLVDSRSEEAAAGQGRFPTAVSLSPEAMLDPERLKENEDMFESLRGAVHIVVMGEGFASLPDLYDQKLTPKLEELMERDESRTNICALFFVKKGFPFVSVLNGGFAAAHSWLIRQGPEKHLNASAVLVDYDPERSLFGQLETLHNASATEKAQRKMQNLLDKSLTVMTRRAQQLEKLASDLDTKEGRNNIRLSIFGGKIDSSAGAVKELKLDGDGTAEKSSAHGFKNPFTGIGKAMASEASPTVTQKSIEKEDGANGTPPPPPPSKRTESEGKSTFRNPFARKQHDGQPSSDHSQETSSSTTEASGTDLTAEDDSSSDKVSKEKKAPPESAPPPPPADTVPKSNRFSSVFRQAPAELPNMLKRNPFARFGGGGGGGTATNTNKDAPEAAPKNTSSTPATTGGFGLGQFRRLAMERVRSFDSDDGAGDVGVESISFDDAPPQQEQPVVVDEPKEQQQQQQASEASKAQVESV